MMRDRRVQLARIDRVRTVQLTLARAAEADAQARAASETALTRRIAQLAAAIAPTPSAGEGFSLAAAAHYRDKLQQSALAANARVAAAEARAADAAAATRMATRDQKAVEKLRARADAEAALAAIRALEHAPSVRRPIRHEPC